jgi:hypothetical protein
MGAIYGPQHQVPRLTRPTFAVFKAKLDPGAWDVAQSRRGVAAVSRCLRVLCKAPQIAPAPMGGGCNRLHDQTKPWRAYPTGKFEGNLGRAKGVIVYIRRLCAVARQWEALGEARPPHPQSMTICRNELAAVGTVALAVAADLAVVLAASEYWLSALTSEACCHGLRAPGPHGSSPQPLLLPRIASKCRCSDSG